MSGRSIRMFLTTGNPRGLRTAELGNWSGHAVACPIGALPALALREEARKTGVYFLTGRHEDAPSGLEVYVGEGDEVWARVKHHETTKNFWSDVVFFTSKDLNLTKAHVRWLEARALELLRQSKRAEVNNTQVPSGGRLPEADQSDMEQFLNNMLILLPVLGVDVFSESQTSASESAATSSPVSSTGTRFVMTYKNASAECELVRGSKFMVVQGSTAVREGVNSLYDGYRERRSWLQQQGVLIPSELDDSLLMFTQDFEFDSASAAATTVSGSNVNGTDRWVLKSDPSISYKQWQAMQLMESESASKDEEDAGTSASLSPGDPPAAGGDAEQLSPLAPSSTST